MADKANDSWSDSSEHGSRSSIDANSIILDSEGNELDETGMKRDPELKGLPLDIKKIGYMKKWKTNKRKFFVLRMNNIDDPNEATFTYFDSEKKFRLNPSSAQQLPKRTIYLKNCFVINHSPEARHQYLMGIFTYDDSFFTICDNAKVLHDWVSLMCQLQFQTRTYIERPLQEISFIWQVSIKQTGLGASRNIYGSYRVYLHKTTLHLSKYDPSNAPTSSSIPNSSAPPASTTSNSQSSALTLSSIDPVSQSYQFPLVSIRRCAHMNGAFRLELGRSSPIGTGELWMNTEDTTVAVNMHEVILAAMSNNGIVNDHSLTLAQHSMQRASFCSSHRPRSLSASTNAEMLKVAAANLLANTGRRSVGAHNHGRLVVTEVVEQPNESSDSGETIVNDPVDSTGSNNSNSIIPIILPPSAFDKPEHPDYLPMNRTTTGSTPPNPSNDPCCVSCGSTSTDLSINKTSSYHHLWSTPNLHFNDDSSDLHCSSKTTEPTIKEENDTILKPAKKDFSEDEEEIVREDLVIMTPMASIRSTKAQQSIDSSSSKKKALVLHDYTTINNDDEDELANDPDYTMMSPQTEIISDASPSSSTSTKFDEVRHIEQEADTAKPEKSDYDPETSNVFTGFTRAYSTGTKLEPFGPSLRAQYVLSNKNESKTANTSTGVMGRIRAFSTGSHNFFNLPFRSKSRHHHQHHHHHERSNPQSSLAASSPETLPLSGSTESKISSDSCGSLVAEKNLRASSAPTLAQSKVGHRTRSATLGSRPIQLDVKHGPRGRSHLGSASSNSNVKEEEEEDDMMEIDYSQNKLPLVLEKVDEDDTAESAKWKAIAKDRKLNFASPILHSSKQDKIDKVATLLDQRLTLEDEPKEDDYCPVDFPRASAPRPKMSSASSTTFYSTVITTSDARQGESSPKSSSVTFGPEVPPAHHFRTTLYHLGPARLPYVAVQPYSRPEAPLPTSIETLEKTLSSEETSEEAESLDDLNLFEEEDDKVEIISAKIMGEEASYVEVKSEGEKSTTNQPNAKKSKSSRFFIFLSKHHSEEVSSESFKSNQRKSPFGNRFLSLHKKSINKRDADKGKMKSKSESCGESKDSSEPASSPLSSSSSMENIAPARPVSAHRSPPQSFV